MKPTRNERLRQVSRMRASFALEALLPDVADLIKQEGYIDGELTLGDMLAYAIAYAEASRLNERGASTKNAQLAA